MMDAQTTAEVITWVDYVGVLMYFPLCMLGLMIHFLKKKVRTEDFIEVKHYFTTHRVSTLTSVLSALVLLYIFDAMDQLNVVSAIMAGYATDSLFQKQVDAMTMHNPNQLGDVDPRGTGGPPRYGDGVYYPPVLHNPNPRPQPPLEFPSDILTDPDDDPAEGA